MAQQVFPLNKQLFYTGSRASAAGAHRRKSTGSPGRKPAPFLRPGPEPAPPGLGMVGAVSAWPPSARMCSARTWAGMARGRPARTATNCFARGKMGLRIPSTSLSAITDMRKTNRWPGNLSRRLWAVASMPGGLWLPSSRKGGALRSSSNRPGHWTAASPARMALSGMSQPRWASTFKVAMAVAAFLGW